MHQRNFQPVGGNACPSQTNTVQTSSSVDGDPVTLRTANGVGCSGGFTLVSSNGDVVGRSERYVTSFPQYATTACYRQDTAVTAGTGCCGDCSSSQPTAFYELSVPPSNAADGPQYHLPPGTRYIDTNFYPGIQHNQFAACHFQPIHQHQHQQQQQQQQPLQGVLDYRYVNVGHVTPSYTSPGPTHRCLPSVPQYTVPLHYTGGRHVVIQQVLQPEIVDQSGAAILRTMLVQSPTLSSAARCQCGPPTLTDVVTSPPESANDEARAFPVQPHGCRRISTCNVMLSQPLSNEDESGNGIELVRRPVMENWNDQLVSESATNQHAFSNSYRQQAATSTENYDARPGANEISETASAVGLQRTPRTARRVVQQAARGTPLYGQPDWWGEPTEEIDQNSSTNDIGGDARNFTANSQSVTDVRRPTNLGLETSFRQTARADVTQTPPERDSGANFGTSSFRDRQMTSQVGLVGASDTPSMTAAIFSTFQQKTQGMTSATSTNLPFQQTTPGFSSISGSNSGNPYVQSPSSSTAQRTPVIDHRLMSSESLVPSDPSEVTPSSRPQSSALNSAPKQTITSTESDVVLRRQQTDNGDVNFQHPLSKNDDDDDEHNRKTSPITTKTLDNPTPVNCRWSNASDSVFNSPADDCSRTMTPQIKVSSVPSTARSNASCAGDENSNWRPPPTGGAAFTVSLDDDDESGGLDLSLKLSTLLPVSLQQRQARTTTKQGRRSQNGEDKRESKQPVNVGGVLSSTKRTSGTFRKATAATSAPHDKKFLTRSNATERYNAADDEFTRTKTIELADEEEEDNEESGDAVSETGTYTIDSSDDDDVKQARKNIEKEFGIQTGDDAASSESSLNLTPSKRRLPLVPDGSTASATNSTGEYIDNQMIEDLQISAAQSATAYSALATATVVSSLSTAVEQLNDSNHQSTLVAKRTPTQQTQTSKEQDSSQETNVGERGNIADRNGADTIQAERGNNQSTVFDSEEARIEARSKWKQISSDTAFKSSTSFQQQQQQVQIVRPEISSSFTSVNVNVVGSRAVDHNVGRIQQPIIMSPVAARKSMTTKSASDHPRNSTTVAMSSRQTGAETTSADQTDISRSRPASRTRSSTPEPFRAAAALKTTAISSNRRGSLQTNQKQSAAEVSGTNRGTREGSVTRSNRSNVAPSSTSSRVTSSAVSHARAQSSSRSTPTTVAAAAVTTTGSNFVGSRSRSASRRSTPQSTTATPAASSSSTFTPINKPPPAEPPILYRSATEVRPAAFRASLTPRSPDKLLTSHNRPSSARLSSSSGVSMTSSSPIMPRRSRPAIPVEASTAPAESIVQFSRVMRSQMRAIMTSPLSSSIDAVNTCESDNGSEISKSTVSAVEETDDGSQRDKEAACNDLLVESIHAMSLRIHKWTTQIFSKQRLTARRPSSGFDDMMTSNSSSSSENIEDWNNVSVSNSNNDNNVKLSRTLSVLTDVERLLSKLST